MSHNWARIQWKRKRKTTLKTLGFDWDIFFPSNGWVSSWGHKPSAERLCSLFVLGTTFVTSQPLFLISKWFLTWLTHTHTPTSMTSPHDLYVFTVSCFFGYFFFIVLHRLEVRNILSFSIREKAPYCERYWCIEFYQMY